MKDDILNLIHNQKDVFLVLLDLSAVFETFVPSHSTSIQFSLATLEKCIKKFKLWMTGNMLKLNNDKSEFFVATSSYFKRTMPLVALRIVDDVINPSKDIRNLGIMFDDVMSMSTQVTTLSRSIIYHLRNITRIRRFMDSVTCSNVVRSLVLSRLDYGNALLLGANMSHLNRL